MQKVYLVSDRTGVTSEALGRSLLSQFPSLDFQLHTYRFIDELEKAQTVVAEVNAELKDGEQAIIISTLADDKIRDVLRGVQGEVLDCFDSLIGPLEKILGCRSSHQMGHTHGMLDATHYQRRIDAVNYAMRHDDGSDLSHYENADVILVGVSRSGKTPTSLYLAMQYGLMVANYPLTEHELEQAQLPAQLKPYRNALVALTIDPQRLQQIRAERLQDSQYASFKQCRREVEQAEAMFRLSGLTPVDVTHMSVEEIAATILPLSRAGVSGLGHVTV